MLSVVFLTELESGRVGLKFETFQMKEGTPFIKRVRKSGGLPHGSKVNSASVPVCMRTSSTREQALT